ncbi:probable pseudouridine-5'-phosphatase isoform X2 [Bradysia coprophila]|uniref:probable pseudouridine-5'-phosphatase isoform X2 n=1 Tax=Bradysia coprophila TaxID=38358 RepID=UPI00187DD3F8|nr:probable pseudouridine-5'-phosphatase isoform X2 [Bradysia coprophila]
MNRLFSASRSSSQFVSKTKAKMSINKVSHCIFDMDGLLLDTETLYTKVYQKILDPFGKVYTWDVKQTLMGSHAHEAAKLMVKTYELPITWEEFAEQAKLLTTEVMGTAEFLPGAERLLKHLHANNVPIALGTSSSKEIAEIKMENHAAIFDLFHHKVMGSTDPDVKIGKPAPDIFIVAAQRFPDKPNPANCLVFEDAPNGVRAATLAGMQSVMVPDKAVAEEFRQEATIVIDSLEDFQPELFGLPPFPTV